MRSQSPPNLLKSIRSVYALLISRAQVFDPPWPAEYIKELGQKDSTKAYQIVDFWRKNILGEQKDFVRFYKIGIEIAEGSQQVNVSGSKALIITEKIKRFFCYCLILRMVLFLLLKIRLANGGGRGATQLPEMTKKGETHAGNKIF